MGIVEKVKGKGPGEAEVSDNMERIKEICAAARKVIGFTPIEPKMLELQTRCYGAKNKEEAMLMEIKSYIKCEMKVLPSEIEKLEIVRIFPPAHKEDWDTLYVEFGSEYEVDKLFGYTKVMVKDDHRLVRWYPKEIFERYRAVESVAYAMRLEKKLRNIKLKTRVKVGIYDLELSTKLPNSTVWRHQTLPDTLPKIELTPSTGPAWTSSPPPGRPGRAEMLAAAVGGVLAHDKALEDAKASQAEKENDKKRQHSNNSEEEDSGKRSKRNLHDISTVRKEMMPGIEEGMGDTKQGAMKDSVGDTNQVSVGDMQESLGDMKESVGDMKQVIVDEVESIDLDISSAASPNKTKHMPDLSVIINSPVIHSRRFAKSAEAQ